MNRASVTGPRLLVLAIGAHGLVVQLVLLRELLASFGGNEISAGLLLGTWVAGEALGAWVAGRLKVAGCRLQVSGAWTWVRVLAPVSAVAGVVAVPAVVLGRGMLGAMAGESLNILGITAVAAMVVFLPALTHGGLFVLGTALLAGDGPDSGIGMGYVWEGAGTALAAAMTWLLLSRVPGVALAAGFGMPLVGMALWTRSRHKDAKLTGGPNPGPGVLGVLVFGLLVAAVLWAGPIERWVWERMWPGQRVREVIDSAYGKTVIMEREGQTLVLYDGVASYSAPAADRVFVEEMAHLPLLASAGPRRVLLLGGIGLVAEVLREPVERVILVQLDRTPVDAALRADSGLRRAAEDPRFELRIQDPVDFTAAGTDSFDCIILGDAMPHSLAGSRMFSLEFYRLCRRRLAAGGVFAVPGPGSAGQVLPETRRILELRLATLAAAFPFVTGVLADFPLFLASDREPLLMPETLAVRLRRRGFQSAVLDSGYLARLFDPFRQGLFQRGLAPSRETENRQERQGAERGVEPSTNTRPAELFRAMVAQSRVSSPWFSRAYEAVGRVRPAHLLVLLGLLLGVMVAGARLRGARFSRPAAVATSGFAGMAITTVAVFAYQLRFGSLYSGVGLLLACFMAGSVLGGIAGTRAAEKGRARMLFFGAESALVVLPVLLIAFARSGPLSSFIVHRSSFALLLFAAGAALGVQFPVAGATIVTGSRSAGRGSGLLLALDLCGGFAGALSTALVLVPVLGLDVACAAVVAVKLVSFAGQLCVRAVRN